MCERGEAAQFLLSSEGTKGIPKSISLPGKFWKVWLY